MPSLSPWQVSTRLTAMVSGGPAAMGGAQSGWEAPPSAGWAAEVTTQAPPTLHYTSRTTESRDYPGPVQNGGMKRKLCFCLWDPGVFSASASVPSSLTQS